MPKKPRRVAVFDFETDPFKYGREPLPFAAGFFDGSQYVDFWGDNCVDSLVDFFRELKEPHLIYAHNGGKFDFFYLLRAGLIENPIKIINGRIVAAKIGIHELRDSYAIIPVPLAAYEKDVIDYSLFERCARESHKADILHYLAKDCEYLFTLVAAFVERFGPKLTIGGTAIEKLREFHPFDRAAQEHDEKYRQFYFGGRVQAFETGIIRGDLKVYDVNSMYPFVMRERQHPAGRYYSTYYDGGVLSKCGMLLDGKPNRPYFAHITAVNRGALPVRTKDGLSFEQDYGEFFATSHEIRAALKHGLLKIEKVHAIHAPLESQNFGAYVDAYIQEKIDGKKEGNKVKEIFAKLLLNSAYGKFGQNPENYFDYKLLDNSEIAEAMRDGWELEFDYGEWAIFRRPSENKSYFDVAVAASITGAARAVLLDALHHAKRPIYCDTDSVICEALPLDLHDSRLGAWKLEGAGDTLACAGKKLYALFSDGKVNKLASKGVRLTGAQIREICEGGMVEHFRDAPAFGLDGSTRFIKRCIRATV